MYEPVSLEKRILTVNFCLKITMKYLQFPVCLFNDSILFQRDYQINQNN